MIHDIKYFAQQVMIFNKKFNVLTSFFFLMALALLLLNDHYLKTEYHNWITGKLSDFSGLFVFSIVISLFFKKHSWIPFIGTALFFIWWKSPLSNSLINIWNSFGFFYIQRVVDYTDLYALSVLPLAFHYSQKSFKAHLKNYSQPLILGLCVFAFVATSQPDDNQYVSLTLQENLSTSVEETRALMTALNDIYVDIFDDTDSRGFSGSVNLSVEGCSGDFFYEFSVEEAEENTSTLTLFQVIYYCPEQDFTPEELTDIFIQEVIDRIK